MPAPAPAPSSEKRSKKNGKKPKLRQLDLKEFRVLLKRCGVRLTDAEINAWFSHLDLHDGGKQGDGKVLFSRALHYIASKMFPWRANVAPLGFEPSTTPGSDKRGGARGGMAGAKGGDGRRRK